jgi:hypothetical protein
VSRPSAPEKLLRVRVRLRLSVEYKALDTYWKQRFKFLLCRFGKDNTKFFHACASARLRKNQIKGLHNGDRVVYNHAEKAKLLHNFYVGLPGASTHRYGASTYASSCRELQELERPFTLQEAKDTVWAMHVDSSPGPDGFGPAFFRTSSWPSFRISTIG